MLVLVDFSNYSMTLAHSVEKYLGREITLDDTRRIIMTNLLKLKLCFPYDSRIILAFDNSTVPYWRKQEFPNYKAKRKAARDKAKFNYELFFRHITDLKAEMKENVPFIQLDIPRCEGDDIIATLAIHNKNERLVVVSKDKDFDQLKFICPKYKRIMQTYTYYEEHDSSEYCLKSHILRGDDSDGIPNIHSPDDQFVNSEIGRQASVYKQFIEDFDSNLMTEQQKKNYERNQKLIDFNFIPMDIQDMIMNEYENATVKNRLNWYLGEFRLEACKETLARIKDKLK